MENDAPTHTSSIEKDSRNPKVRAVEAQPLLGKAQMAMTVHQAATRLVDLGPEKTMKKTAVTVDFDKADANGDGTISREEWKALVESQR